jgi:Ca2+-binding EF-hand superfamily protein
MDAHRQLIAAIDSDQDGRLSLAEWSASTEPARDAGRASPIRIALHVPAADMFRLLDSNEDGLLTLEELVRQPLAIFDCMDIDHDGVVQAGETEAGEARCSSIQAPEPAS